MSSITYSWKIESVNLRQKSFVVQYTCEGKDPISLNMLLPADPAQLQSTIENAAPVREWTKLEVVDVPLVDIVNQYVPEELTAMTGTATHVPKVSPNPDEVFKERVKSILAELNLIPAQTIQ
jgi:hypothetical protein